MTKSKRAHRRVVVAVAGLLTLAACSSDPPRGETLAGLANEAIVPAFAQLADSTTSLQKAMVTLCELPSEQNLADAIEALAATSWAWAYSEPMWAGPVEARNSYDVIDGQLATGPGGLGLIESQISVNGALDQITEPDCAELTRVSTLIADEADAVFEAWTVSWNGGAGYVDGLATSDGDDLDMIVNDSLVLLEAMADDEIGVAVGAAFETATLDVIDEGPAGLGTSDMRGHVAGLRAIFLGSGSSGTGSGLSLLLDDTTTATLTRQFDRAEAALDAVGSPLKAEIENSLQAVGEVRDSLIEIQVTISTEVVSQLGVTVGFADADGDTGS